LLACEKIEGLPHTCVPVRESTESSINWYCHRFFVEIKSGDEGTLSFALLAIAGCSLACPFHRGFTQAIQAHDYVTFSCDFSVTPACSSATKEKCVQQFNFHDISPGIYNRVKLGSIPTPANATGFVKEITGTTKPFLFTSGKHMVAVSAQMPDGSESDLSQCTRIIKIH